MPIHGLKSGLAIRGMQSGVLSGNALAGIESGYRSGMNNNLPEKQKMLNPINLSGDKKPLLYGLADYNNITGGNTTNLNDIANTGNFWRSNSSIASRPIPTANKLNGKTMLYYAGTISCMFANGTVTSSVKSGYTIMAVIKLNGKPGGVVFDNNSISAGSILVSCPSNSASPLRMSSRFYSSTSTGATYVADVGPTTSSSNDNIPYEFSDYMIVTAKYRLIQPTGDGSEQDFFINGRRHHTLLGTDNFTETSLKRWSFSSFGIGNNPVSQNSVADGFEMGMGMILPYWLEYSEQVKIENYFRWYYNKSF
jgi:hypothetical protein